jgi:hypothetical protein
MILAEYGRVARSLDGETFFKAHPLHIVVDGPYSINAYMDVVISEKAFMAKGAQALS